ncbi:MAG: MBOAT family protein [Lachnospiraceae bacterium]|nr:MBOAT family protein [Lachnospiraceae bacterium]
MNVYFIVFLPLAMLVYQLTPKKYRWISLLASSVVFFGLISKYLILWALLTTALTYAGGVLIGRCGNEIKSAKRILWYSLVAVVGILVGLKYTNFTIEIINRVMAGVGVAGTIPLLNILVPIGISFYTLQAIGYLLDVYWKRIAPEQNYFRLLLFLIYFPTVMEGPICRWTDVSEQLFQGEGIHQDNLTKGCIRIAWGLFKRMIIADRLNVAVNALYGTNIYVGGAMVIVSMFITTIQLYMEFSGTIDIVIGSSRIFNIVLPENFRQPFLAKSASEFWRRWHISLGTWFKNYIFYPVTTSPLMKKWNKFGRKHAGKYITTVVTSAIALFPVWMLNGLWHGPKFPYIMYGIYYFIVLLLEVMLEPAGKAFWKKLHCKEEGFVVSAVRMVRTWGIVLVGEMLFRAQTIGQFFLLMKRIFSTTQVGGGLGASMMEIGMDIGDYAVVIIGSVIVFVVEIILEKQPDFFERLPEWSTPKRWLVYYSVIMAIIVFGAYGDGYQPADLIYAGF